MRCSFYPLSFCDKINLRAKPGNAMKPPLLSYTSIQCTPPNNGQIFLDGRVREAPSSCYGINKVRTADISKLRPTSVRYIELPLYCISTICDRLSRVSLNRGRLESMKMLLGFFRKFFLYFYLR